MKAHAILVHRRSPIDGEVASEESLLTEADRIRREGVITIRDLEGVFHRATVLEVTVTMKGIEADFEILPNEASTNGDRPVRK